MDWEKTGFSLVAGGDRFFGKYGYVGGLSCQGTRGVWLLDCATAIPTHPRTLDDEHRRQFCSLRGFPGHVDGAIVIDHPGNWEVFAKALETAFASRDRASVGICSWYSR